MIAAGGLRAKGLLSFKTGVYGAIGPPKAARRALWDKNSKPLSFEKFLKLSQLLSPKQMKRDVASFGGMRSIAAPKIGCN